MSFNLSFVILTWNSEKYIWNCLSSLLSKCDSEGLQYEIFLVDNGSKDRTLQLVDDFRRRNNPPLKTFLLNKNNGTTRSRNIALKKVATDYLCVLDSDTEIVSGSISKILLRLGESRDIGIIAPRLVLPDGQVQNSVKKFPSLWQKLAKIPGALFKFSGRNHDFYEGFPFQSPTYVDTAISACWFFRRELLSDIGYLDERIFYAPEDLDFCMRAWKKGKRVLYEPSLTIMHNTQQISHKKPLSRIAIMHLWGLLYYYRKHRWYSSP